ncbi:MAG: glycosyltransferase [Candidatus Hydrogenedentota bacterium]
MTHDNHDEAQQTRPAVSIIVPAYREAENIAPLVARIAAVRDAHGLDIEVVIVDDNSRDGTEEAVAGIGCDWVRLVVRTKERGLSSAVLAGYREARGDVFIVMDADLSHPPEKIPEMLAVIEDGADFVLGSRYVAGGSTDEEWGVFRAINSRVATLLARPFTRIKDPMSGFFAIRRETWENAGPLNPIGYKIGLEILVKCCCQDAREIPIHFSQRLHGESKLSLTEQLRYLQHLRRLAMYKYTEWSHVAQFMAVGFSGVFVNLATLTVLDLAGVNIKLAVAVAILTAMVSNFWLNRWFTFPHARAKSWLPQLFGFISASSFGAVLNWCTVMLLVWLWPVLDQLPQAPALAGIIAGLGSNYLASRYLVFRKAEE